MCFDGEQPAFMTRETPRARKQYVCCECGGKIEPKEQYEYVFGKWGSYLDTYRTCMACVALRRKIELIEVGHGCYASDSVPPFTELIDAAREYGLFPNTEGR